MAQNINIAAGGGNPFAPGGAMDFHKIECKVCFGEFPLSEIQKLGCGHHHCNGCVKTNAKAALESSPFTPAKCCHVIDKASITKASALTPQEMQTYLDKLEELTNPRAKLYCHDGNCGKFIPAANHKRRVGECGECGKKTCRSCNQKSHFGACDQAKLKEAREAEDQVLKLAESKGWKRCPNCRNVVQRNGGCHHMTCSCGQLFCYKCGEALSADFTPHDCPKNQPQ